jgi:hypothetical protein
VDMGEYEVDKCSIVEYFCYGEILTDELGYI